MRPSHILPLILLALLPACFVGATDDLPGKLRFDRLGISDGLSNSSISSIVQDETGLIWFGTQSGLNRYDGYSVTRFEHDPFDRNSLSHNLIQTMSLDESGVIWIGTYGGLNRFDSTSGTFDRYVNSPGNPGSLSNNVVTAIERDAAGRLWVGTLQGLNRLDSDSGEFDRYYADDVEGALPNEVIRSLTRDRLGRLWIGTYGGLSLYVSESDSFETVGTEGAAGETLPSPYVMCIVPDPEDDTALWLGTWDGGVSRFDTQSGEVETIEVPNDDIYSMMFDRHGRLWVGTWGGGLSIIDVQTGDIRSVTAADEPGPSGLAHDIVYSLLEDDSGIVWLGTNGGGVNSYVPWENQFETFENDPNDPNSIPPGKINSIWVDSNSDVWIGTYTGGIGHFDNKTGRIDRYSHDPDDPSSLGNDIVNTMLRDSQGRLWVGTNGGLDRYDETTNSFERVRLRGEEPLENVVFCIYESVDGALWLGTNTAGIVVYDPATGEVGRLVHNPDDDSSLSNNLVRCITRDDRGWIWVGTNQGLNRYDPSSGDFVRYLHDVDNPGSLPSNDVRAVFQDSAGALWIATTGGGVAKYDYTADRFSQLSTKEGLASNHVIGILEGNPGEIWFATKRGISVHTPDTGGFRTLNTSSGLLSNELTQATAKGPDGRLYFGGAGGVTVVDADQHAAHEFEPPVVITRFEVLGRQQTLSTDSEGQYHTVELDDSDKFFSVEYAALDYSTPSHNTYAYKLEGFDDEWQYVGDRTYATYTNLGPGKYALSIRGAGSRGNWNDEGVTLPIVVLPPWWQSTPALVGYVVLLLAILAWVYAAINKKQRLTRESIAKQKRINEELERKVAERTKEIEKSRSLAEKATLAKSRFLANMSHEIRTPLTGMTGMMSLLSRTDLDEVQSDYLRYLETAAENLTTLVNDLLDFERIESGELRLVSEPFSITAAVQYIEHLFRPAAEEKDLSFLVHIDLDDSRDGVRGDRSRLIQVLTNLVSNAVKYTVEGTIEISVSSPGPAGASCTYRFEVADSGVGFDATEQDRVFERFRQLEDGYSKSGRGVGLGLSIVKQVVETMGGDVEVESAKGVGSRFVVTLPLETETAAVENGPATTTGASPAVLSRRESRPGAADGKAKLLVCEDEVVNRLYLSRYLGSRGFVVEEAGDGNQAFERATRGDIDLVLMDIGMPGINGLEATAKIRDWEQAQNRPPMPIIALTAHSYPEDIERCVEAGMNGHVEKPVREASLDAAIAEALGTTAR